MAFHSWVIIGIIAAIVIALGSLGLTVYQHYFNDAASVVPTVTTVAVDDSGTEVVTRSVAVAADTLALGNDGDDDQGVTFTVVATEEVAREVSREVELGGLLIGADYLKTDVINVGALTVSGIFTGDVETANIIDAGTALGVATLGEDGLVLASQLPTSTSASAAVVTGLREHLLQNMVITLEELSEEIATVKTSADELAALLATGAASVATLSDVEVQELKVQALSYQVIIGDILTLVIGKLEDVTSQTTIAAGIVAEESNPTPTTLITSLAATITGLETTMVAVEGQVDAIILASDIDIATIVADADGRP